MKCMEGSKENNIEILGVWGLMWILEPLKILEKSWKFVSEKGYEPWSDLLSSATQITIFCKRLWPFLELEVGIFFCS